MAEQPLAYFLTFTTYGTWLHGDARGSLLRVRTPQRLVRVEPNEALRAGKARLLKTPPVILGPEVRSIVERALHEASEHYSWRLFALNVRTSHVHVVVHSEGSPERTMTRLKAWATRRLREAGLHSAHAPLWTRHGSTRYVWDDTGLERVVGYVRYAQDDPKS